MSYLAEDRDPLLLGAIFIGIELLQKLDISDPEVRALNDKLNTLTQAMFAREQEASKAATKAANDLQDKCHSGGFGLISSHEDF